MDALRDLEVWRRGCRLSVAVFQLLETCREPNYRSQVARSALSIPSNIAEGYERGLPGERNQFLRIAKGSCGELWTQLWVGLEAGFIDKPKSRELIDETEQISKMLAGLIRHFSAKS